MTQPHPLTHSPEDLRRFLKLVEPTAHPPNELVRSIRDASAGAVAARMRTIDLIRDYADQRMCGYGPSVSDINDWWDDAEPGKPLAELARREAEQLRNIAFDYEMQPGDNHPDVVAKVVGSWEETADALEAWADAPREDFLAELERQIADEGPNVDAVMRRVNRSHFTVTKDGGYAVGREQLNPSLGHREVAFFTESAIKKDLDRRRVEVPDGKGGSKAVGVGTAWAAHPGRRHYRHVTFDPDPRFFEGVGDDRTLNLFRGFAIEPDPLADWSPLRTLIREVICGGIEERYDFVTRWAAQMVQRPHEAAGVVLSMPGPKGAGKGTLGRALAGLVDPHGLQIAQSDQLTGKFNSHLARTICLFVDEAFWSGDRRAENLLKALITEPTFVCEPKGVDAFQVHNRLHIVMATNNDCAAPADLGDRRYAVLSPNKEAVAEFKRRVGFGRVLEGQGQVRREVLAGWMQHLIRVDVDGWRADEHIPETEALARQRLLTSRRDAMTGWWETVLQRGGSEHFRMPGWPDGFGEVGPPMKEELERDLHSYVLSLPYREKSPDKAAVARWLRERFGYQTDANVGVGRERRRGWLLPPLSEARQDFERMIGAEGAEWESIDAIDWTA